MVKRSRKDSAHASPSTGSPNLTLIDVAKVAGVSPITVSRALHRPGMVSDLLRDKVLEAVRTTGYVPNMLAGGLASKRSRLIAIFVPTIAHSIFAETVQSLMDHLDRAGYQTMLGLTGYSAEQEERLLNAVLGRRPDGIVLTGTLHTPSSRQRLSQAGIPVVESWDLSDTPIDMQVGFSHEKVGVATADHLHAKGYRRFAVVSVDDQRALKRIDSLVARLAQLGIERVPRQILPTPATFETGRDGLRDLLAAGAQPDVVVCSSDTVAHGVVAEAASRGVRIPHDLAVMGFGDLSSGRHGYPALSTVSVNGSLIGQMAARALLLRLDHAGAEHEPARVDTGFSIIDRATT